MSVLRLTSFAALVSVATLTFTTCALAQPPSGAARPAEPDIEGIPKAPTAVALPTLSAPVTGPGPMFDSAPSQMKGLDPSHFRYRTTEYFVSGTADGKPYTTTWFDMYRIANGKIVEHWDSALKGVVP